MGMKLRWLGILIAVVAYASAAQAQAQTIYKCTDGKGGTAFQQSPCEGTSKTESVRSYQRQPDAPHDYGQYEQPENFQFQGEPSDAGRAQPQYQASRQPDINPMSAEAEMRRRMENMSRSREGRALQRQMSGQQLTHAPVATPDPNRGIGQPVRIIDPSTSMPIEGAIKVAPNRIWDPKTGEYYWTTP
jgi:hypothetical protein